MIVVAKYARPRGTCCRKVSKFLMRLVKENLVQLISHVVSLGIVCPSLALGTLKLGMEERESEVALHV